MYALLNLCEGKKTVLVGRADVAMRCARKLKLIGIVPSYLLDSETDSDEEFDGDSTFGLKAISIEELKKMECPYYILLTERKGEEKQAKYLIDNGYAYLKDFGYIDKACAWGKLTAGNSLDPTMGYSSVAYDENGVKIRGNIDSAGLKIGILGASLADETYFDRKIWTQFLYERMISTGKDIIEILGASYGYTTSQCVLKLLRDVIPYKPDIVLDYCPLENDCFYGESLTAPYIVGYQKKMMSLLNGRLKDRFEEKMVRTFSFGVQCSKRTSDIILDNMRLKKAICDAYGIMYICVFPPSCVTKKVLSSKDMSLQWCWEKNGIVAKKVYSEIEKKMEESLLECVVDARDWVDGEEGAFYDQFHMYERGNQIVADKLADILNDLHNGSHFGLKRHMWEEMEFADMDDNGHQQWNRL